MKVFGEPISIKTFTGKGFSGIKLAWTVDAKSSKEFLNNYNPSCDILVEMGRDKSERYRV